MKNPMRKTIEKFRGWSNAQRGLVVLLAAGLCVAVFAPAHRQISDSRLAVPQDRLVQTSDNEAAANSAPSAGPVMDDKDLRELQANAAATREALGSELARTPAAPSASGYANANPLIAHTAELAVATKEFARSRTSLEEILERHRGYAAKLRMVGQKSGSVLSATLRVPSTELGGTVTDLKALGEVEREEQAADEITQQRTDLDARLANAQNTLRRLKELLEKQTYPDGNVRELQRQIANASAEVTRLEAERQASEHRVIFANVYFTLREEIVTPAETLGGQLRSAAAAGFGEAMSSLSALLVFLIGRGPVVVLWCAILFVPARWLWRKWTPATVQAQGQQTAAAQAD